LDEKLFPFITAKDCKGKDAMFRKHDHAYQWSRSRMGGWRIAQSPIWVTTITLERLRKRAYESLLSYYEKVVLHLNEPPPDGRAGPCTRPVSAGWRMV